MKSVKTGAMCIPLISEEGRGLWLVQVALGALFLAFCAQISLPLYPVPMTLQTLGVYMLAVAQGGKKGCCSALLYLLLISCGLPLLAAGVASPLWFLLPRAGYLFAFPLAILVSGLLLDRASRRNRCNAFSLLLSLACGGGVIFLCGVGYLTRFLSLQESLQVGLFPFLPLEGVKLLVASLCGWWRVADLRRFRGR